MSEYLIQTEKDGRPVFTSNGIKVLMASGCEMQITLLDRERLENSFGAELIAENVECNPYWQIGQCTGSIYKLKHFPIDGTDADYSGLLVFNVEPAGDGAASAGSGTASADNGAAPAGSGVASAGSGAAPAGSGVASAGSGTAPAGSSGQKIEAIVSTALFDRCKYSSDEWTVALPQNMENAVKRANEPLEELLG